MNRSTKASSRLPSTSDMIGLCVMGSECRENPPSPFFALFPPLPTTDILELVKQGLAPDMLEDELDVKERLAILRKRPTDALALFDQILDKPVAWPFLRQTSVRASDGFVESKRDSQSA